ncbi:hypothetical protein HJC10_00255 [Corallococcus exiguus]|uniref:hypothetical protein n=1 Tax=Corallococcus exiguus TaxID=83462 RepID=UPI0014710383|nr:hypothetical protein [Corallococcus exiguus]NNB92478.1 hypothetical protein [Corallococcus exiguus]NNC01296.1 hypothetical protein [Corallococcus exiguus]
MDAKKLSPDVLAAAKFAASVNKEIAALAAADENEHGVPLVIVKQVNDCHDFASGDPVKWVARYLYDLHVNQQINNGVISCARIRRDIHARSRDCPLPSNFEIAAEYAKLNFARSHHNRIAMLPGIFVERFEAARKVEERELRFAEMTSPLALQQLRSDAAAGVDQEFAGAFNRALEAAERFSDQWLKAWLGGMEEHLWQVRALLLQAHLRAAIGLKQEVDEIAPNESFRLPETLEELAKLP